MNCNQCEMLSINGVACHEIGCTNSHARWDTDATQWVKQRECFICGYTCDKDTECCTDEETQS